MLVNAQFIQSRQDDRVLMRTVLIVSGVRSDGYREILGVRIGDSESFATWDKTFRWLKGRGLKGVAFVVSDQHGGLREAVAAQGQRSGARWADALSATVRPVITYWFMAFYCAAKSATFVGAVEAGAEWIPAIQVAWTEADQALWAGVLNFWFLGRVFDRVRP